MVFKIRGRLAEIVDDYSTDISLSRKYLLIYLYYKFPSEGGRVFIAVSY